MSDSEQAVIVRAAIASEGNDQMLDDLSALEDRLIEAIRTAEVGEFDGNEIGQGQLVLYMYGPDAEKLFSTVEPLLRGASLTQRAIATVRKGPPGSASRQVALGE